MRGHTVSLLLAGACLLVPAAVVAQVPTDGTDVAADPAIARHGTTAASPAATATDGDASEVVVTGSRVISSGNNSPTPVTVVSNDLLQATRPSTIAEGLNTLPVFSGSKGQISTPNPTSAVGAGNGTASALNLRNIGANRNLILLDGRRLPPTTTNNVVDVDMIPQALIQRVEVVTGGVSAVYGSDAVTGVVNFITDRHYTGIGGHAQTGISDYGDGAQYNAGVVAGTDLFGGRGHVEASYEYRSDAGVDRKSSRPWFDQPGVAGAGTATAPFQLLRNVRLANQPYGGRILSGTFSGQYFAENGVLSPFVNGTATSTAGSQIGGAGGYQDWSLRATLRSHQAFGRFDFDVTDDIHAFAVATANIKENESFTDYVSLANVTLSNSNGFLSPAIRAQLAPAGTFTFGKLLADGPRYNPISKSDQYLFVTGLNGSLGGAKWDLAYTYGYTRLKTILGNNVNQQKLAASLDAVVNPATGQVVCNAALTNPALYGSCVPLNVFGPSVTSAAATGYFLENSSFTSRTRQNDVVASVSGSPFGTWAGPVNVALSGEYRDQSFSDTSNAEPVFADCTGLRYNCVASGSSATLLYRTSFPSSPKVSQNVWEAAVEANLPLLRDAGFIGSFELNGAARYTKYQTVGSYWTWKGGAVAHLADDAITLRGTISRDIRAPTLNDLYAPTQAVLRPDVDLLTGVSRLVTSITAGNPDLTAEIGMTKTAGLVLKAPFLPGFSLAVDYFDIKVTNAIMIVPGYNQAYQASCYDSGGTSPYCALQVRPGGYSRTAANQLAANAVTTWYTSTINIAEIQANGLDAEANYAGRLFGRPLVVRGLGSYAPHIKYLQPAVATVDQAGVVNGASGILPAPKLRLTGIVSLEPAQGFRVDVEHRWRSAMKIFPTGEFIDNRIRAFAQTALNLNWQVPTGALHRAEFFFNVQNLFNNDPPEQNSAPSANAPGAGGGFAQSDDPVGRYYTIGVRMKL